MFDPSLQLRQWYYEQLNGMIFLSSVAVPVYDNVPMGEDFPFIVLSDNFSVNYGNKDNDMTMNSVQVDIYTGFQNNTGGKKQSDEIGEQILEIILNSQDETTNFKILTSTFESSNYMDMMSESHKIVRKIIKINHLVQKIS